MSSGDVLTIGIDATSGREPFTLAALDEDLRLVTLHGAELREILDFLDAPQRAAVAINSPSHISAKVVRRRLERDLAATHVLRGASLREAEFELHSLGIAVAGTPDSEALCPAWIQAGFGLYRGLSSLGYKPFPKEAAARQWLETHPQAGFCVVLGHVPLPKPTLEGRLQRALALFERGVHMPDPMSFFEEITRHRILSGTLPTEMIPQVSELDALVAAFTAWLALYKPEATTRLGNPQEGFITLPAAKLKTTYSL